MPKRVFVRPGEGRTVRMKNGLNCPADGLNVQWSIYIQRRIDCGDLVVGDPPAEMAAPVKAPAAVVTTTAASK